MMVSAHAARLRLTLATVAADNARSGGGEREAAPEVPGLIALKGTVVTADTARIAIAARLQRSQRVAATGAWR